MDTFIIDLKIISLFLDKPEDSDEVVTYMATYITRLQELFVTLYTNHLKTKGMNQDQINAEFEKFNDQEKVIDNVVDMEEEFLAMFEEKKNEYNKAIYAYFRQKLSQEQKDKVNAYISEMQASLNSEYDQARQHMLKLIEEVEKEDGLIPGTNQKMEKPEEVVETGVEGLPSIDSVIGSVDKTTEMETDQVVSQPSNPVAQVEPVSQPEPVSQSAQSVPDLGNGLHNLDFGVEPEIHETVTSQVNTPSINVSPNIVEQQNTSTSQPHQNMAGVGEILNSQELESETAFGDTVTMQEPVSVTNTPVENKGFTVQRLDSTPTQNLEVQVPNQPSQPVYPQAQQPQPPTQQLDSVEQVV